MEDESNSFKSIGTEGMVGRLELIWNWLLTLAVEEDLVDRLYPVDQLESVSTHVK